MKKRLIDDVEVVNGHWKPIPASIELYECSVCDKWQYIPEEMFNYCPHCGAKMDGDENGTLD